MQYRKKPVVIEAVQHLKDEEVDAPAWLAEAMVTGVIFEGADGELYINTLEGKHHVSDRDFIIRGVKGELYPCKPDIFEATYTEV